MSDIKHYKNVSYVKGHVRVNLRFAKYGPRFAKAQEWLGQPAQAAAHSARARRRLCQASWPFLLPP